MIAIIDYGMGNVGSIVNMLKALNYQSVVTADHETIRKSDHVILPGVGAFDKGMTRLNDSGLSDLLRDLSHKESKPITGICLGMQLLTKGSEEGGLPGLGLVDAYTYHFSKVVDGFDLRIPHMGWNTINKYDAANILCEEIPDPSKFYFVHSYFVKCNQAEDILMQSTYGDAFTAAFTRNNVTGFQFHPEKSHKYGMQLLKTLMEKTYA